MPFLYRTQVLMGMGYLYFLLLCMFTKEQKHICKAKMNISPHLIIDRSAPHLGYITISLKHVQFRTNANLQGALLKAHVQKES